MTSILDRRLVFVTGKGGVGKTSVAAALGKLAARLGKRTLVCEMDAKGALAEAFGVGELGFESTPIDDNLSAMTMNTEDSLREYLRLYVPVPFLGRITPLASTFDFVADAAPGVKEILAVGKLCWEVRERHYDIVIVDAEATGHIVAQIGAPKVIRQLVKVGLVHDQTEWMLKLLQDPAICGVAVVTTPEEMPVVETIGLLERLEPETGVTPTVLVANRVQPALFDRRQGEIVEGLNGANDVLTAAIGKGATSVVEAARITEARRRTGARHLDRLVAASPNMEMLIVPELFTRATGRRVVSLVADSLAEELDVIHPDLAGGS